MRSNTIEVKTKIRITYRFSDSLQLASDIENILQWYGASVFCITDNIGYINQNRLDSLLIR